MADSNKVKVRIGQVVYYREVEDHRNPGKTVMKADVATRGEEIEVNERDYEKGQRLGWWVGSVDEPQGDGTPDEASGFSASEAGVDEIAAHIEDNNLNVEETVDLAGGDANTAERVLEAERQVAQEAGDDPRKGVIDGLSKVIGGN